MSTVIYKLAKGKDPNKKGVGFKKKYPISFSLPAISRVSYQDPDTGEIIKRKARYCKDESSIWMDEQDPSSVPTKVRFSNGFVRINTVNDPAMYKYVEVIDTNGSKEGRNTSKKILFYRNDPEAEANKQLEHQEEVAKHLARFWEMSEQEREAIATLWGIKTTSMETGVWSMKLFLEAQKNPKRFVELTEGSDLDILILSIRAKKLDLLKFHQGEWLFENSAMFRVGLGQDRNVELMNFFTRHPDMMQAVEKETTRLEDKLKGMSVVDKMVKAYTAAEVLEKGMDAKVLFYDKGKGWKFTEGYSGLRENEVFGNENRKIAAIEYIKQHPDVKKEILLRREASIKAEIDNK